MPCAVCRALHAWRGVLCGAVKGCAASCGARWCCAVPGRAVRAVRSIHVVRCVRACHACSTCGADVAVRWHVVACGGARGCVVTCVAVRRSVAWRSAARCGAQQGVKTSPGTEYAAEAGVRVPAQAADAWARHGDAWFIPNHQQQPLPATSSRCSAPQPCSSLCHGCGTVLCRVVRVVRPTCRPWQAVWYVGRGRGAMRRGAARASRGAVRHSASPCGAVRCGMARRGAGGPRLPGSIPFHQHRSR